jgi:hypothetical protein
VQALPWTSNGPRNFHFTWTLLLIPATHQAWDAMVQGSQKEFLKHAVSAPLSTSILGGLFPVCVLSIVVQSYFFIQLPSVLLFLVLIYRNQFERRYLKIHLLLSFTRKQAWQGPMGVRTWIWVFLSWFCGLSRTWCLGKSILGFLESEAQRETHSEEAHVLGSIGKYSLLQGYTELSGLVYCRTPP